MCTKAEAFAQNILQPALITPPTVTVTHFPLNHERDSFISSPETVDRQAGSRGPDLYRQHQQELLTGWEKWRICLWMERGELLGLLLRAGRGPGHRGSWGPPESDRRETGARVRTLGLWRQAQPSSVPSVEREVRLSL